MWDEWLKSNIVICVSYARRQGEIYRLLSPYIFKFSTVRLSFYVVFNIRKELKAMFESSAEIRDYWSETALAMVYDNEQQQSQQLH